jgi:hypothetical protein
MIWAFIACQAFVVSFIALHDWIPLGTLNNVRGTRSADTPRKLVVVTLISVLPFALALVGTVRYAGSAFPPPLSWLIWLSYGLGLYGLLRAWYVPYLLRPEPERAERYNVMFAHTHSFLPKRNGIAPNTLHAIFHAVFLATVAIIVYLTATHVLVA